MKYRGEMMADARRLEDRRRTGSYPPLFPKSIGKNTLSSNKGESAEGSPEASTPQAIHRYLIGQRLCPPASLAPACESRSSGRPTAIYSLADKTAVSIYPCHSAVKRQARVFTTLATGSSSLFPVPCSLFPVLPKLFPRKGSRPKRYVQIRRLGPRPLNSLNRVRIRNRSFEKPADLSNYRNKRQQVA